MFDLDNLIGFEVSRAKSLLQNNGFKNINIMENFKPNEKCDTKIVCSVILNEDMVTLVCGEFYLDIKE